MASGEAGPLTGPESDRAACLADAAERFERAARAEPVHERSFTIAERQVVFRFAGPRLVEPLGGGFEHHPPGGPSGARLTIHLWEASGAGGMPAFPESALDGGITWRGRTDEPQAIMVQYQPQQGALCVLDRASNTAYVCVADADALPYWEVGQPLRVLIQWWMEHHGRLLVHGGALGTDGGGVLLVGGSGSGKSSTALAVLSPRADPGRLRFAGDDYCLAGVGEKPWVHNLYGTAKLTADQAARFPDLVAGPVLNAARVGEEEKALFMVSRRFADRMIHGFPLAAIVVPMIGGDRCRVERITGGVALRALAPSSLLQLPGAGGRVLATLADLTRRVPSYALRLSPDPRDAPAVLAELVDTLVDRR